MFLCFSGGSQGDVRGGGGGWRIRGKCFTSISYFVLVPRIIQINRALTQAAQMTRQQTRMSLLNTFRCETERDKKYQRVEWFPGGLEIFREHIYLRDVRVDD